MTFRARNTYHLRISTHVVLPLFLYLDERHIDWMSDVVLQHVLADLRPLIIPKLQAEKDVHFGPGATPGSRRGTVEVHCGETYQFAYFFRKTEPHTVLFKSRYFVTASPCPKAVPNTLEQLASRHPQRKKLGSRVPGKRKRARSQDKSPEIPLDGDEWFAEETEQDTGADPIEREPHPLRKQRHRITAGATQEDDELDGEDVAMDSTPPEMDGGSVEQPGVHSPKDRDSIALDADDRPSDVVDTGLVVEEEENKPKPLLKLKYQSFSMSGHCLCIVVEPWPSLRAETKLPTCLGLERSVLPSTASVVPGQRERTPLFLPEHDRAPSEVPFTRERTLPTWPPGDDYSDDDLMNFSQALNATDHMHAIAADDDDDMDGAVLFGDADEVREF